MTLTGFLLARIEETEKRAKMAATSPITWLHFANDAGGLDWHVGQYMLDVAPARVLAECEAKRQIVERTGAVRAGYPSHHLAQGVLSLLAMPYADHPDYQQEWKP